MMTQKCTCLNLLVGSSRISMGGVFIYAMMAAGGDLGASVGPQLVGNEMRYAYRDDITSRRNLHFLIYFEVKKKSTRRRIT